MINKPYIIYEPSVNRLPILISCPHVGTEIPEDIASHMTSEALELPDTDWFVHNLYAFAPALGITLIHARFNRYVIDLNRNPEGTRLYADLRAETSLVPTHTFGLQPIYKSDPPSKTEINRRYNLYFQPYHEKITSILQDLKQTFPNVLLFDAHSIKRYVPSIRPEPFPDVILGDQQGKTAHPSLTTTALAKLATLRLAHNTPFMGGYITRTFGRPKTGIHALQLEMSQDLYMNESKSLRDSDKEQKVQEILRHLLVQLGLTLEEIN